MRGGGRYRCAAAVLVLAVLAGPAGAPAARGQEAPVLRLDSSRVAPRAVPEAALQPFRDDPAFRYTRAKAPETWWDRFKRWLADVLTAPLRSPGLAPWRRFVFYALVALVLGYALMRLLRMEPGGLFYARRASPAVRLDEADADPRGLDLDALIAEAVAAHDYRRAVRLSYLRVLRRLAERGLIDWRTDKTNHDYVAELGASPLRPAFARLTAAFEYAWYGDFPVDAATFARVHDDFDALIRRVDGPLEGRP